MDDDLRKQLVLWLITHDAISRDEPPHGAASSSDSLFYFNIEYRIKYFNLRILAKLITKDRNIKYIRNESRINDFGNQLKNAIGLVLSGDYCVEGNEQMICISSDEDAALVVTCIQAACAHSVARMTSSSLLFNSAVRKFLNHHSAFDAVANNLSRVISIEYCSNVISYAEKLPDYMFVIWKYFDLFCEEISLPFDAFYLLIDGYHGRRQDYNLIGTNHFQYASFMILSGYPVILASDIKGLNGSS
jgi:hypothetical protein